MQRAEVQEVTCSDCARKESCPTHEHMQKISDDLTPGLEQNGVGYFINTLEEIEKFAEHCTNYTNTICSTCSSEEECDEKTAWRTLCVDYQDITKCLGTFTAIASKIFLADDEGKAHDYAAKELPFGWSVTRVKHGE